MAKNPQIIFDHVISCLKSGIGEFSGDEVSMRCPGCDDEKGHFSVNTRLGLYHCFKCGISGGFLSVILKNRKEWFSIVRKGQSNSPLKYIRKERGVCPLDAEPITAILDATEECVSQSLKHKLAKKAMRYCLKRGMTRKQIEQYQVSIKKYDPRVYFPYWGESNEITFWTGRVMNDNTELKKSIEPDNSEKPLYGRHIEIIRNEVVLVEGTFDHFVTPTSYAVMGSSVTTIQTRQLKKDGVKRVFLVFDPDANEQSQRTTKKLAKEKFDVFPILINNYQDPAKIGRATMSRIIQTAKQHHPVRPQPLYFSL